MTRYEQLRYAIEVLASPADNQISYLARVGHFDVYKDNLSTVDELWNIDEVGLQFEDIACAVNGMMEAGEIDGAQRDCVAKLDKILDMYSGEENTDFWTVKALRCDPRWDVIRQNAKNCLSIFN